MHVSARACICVGGCVCVSFFFFFFEEKRNLTSGMKSTSGEERKSGRQTREEMLTLSIQKTHFLYLSMCRSVSDSEFRGTSPNIKF